MRTKTKVYTQDGRWFPVEETPAEVFGALEATAASDVIRFGDRTWIRNEAIIAFEGIPDDA